jgi:hypothetical protein
MMKFDKEGTPLEKLRIGKSRIQLNYDWIEDITFDCIDFKDSPDFCDAYIDSATYEGREMTEEELDILNEDRDFVYDKLMDHLY